MYNHDATEIAYNNGYEKGFEDGRKSVNLVIRLLALDRDSMTAEITYELNGRKETATCGWYYKNMAGDEKEKNMRRADFQVGLVDSDGNVVEGTARDVCVLWNRTIISDEEVFELIDSGMYEYDKRVIATTPKQADNFRGKINDN